VPGIDVRRLPIGPEEAFILSRVDGRLATPDIAASTGLSEERVHAALGRLLALGAIQYGAPPSERPAARQSAPDAPQSNDRITRPVIEDRPNNSSSGNHPAAALYDPAELDEPVDLELPRKRAILDMFYRLDALNHYELLGVREDAEKKEIKNAYFKVVGLFHPDRYFGKSLGSFRTKLERVFAQLTLAHDVLTRRQSREDYDRYLITQKRNRAFERLMTDERGYAVEVERARRRIEQEARFAERTQGPRLRPPTLPDLQSPRIVDSDAPAAPQDSTPPEARNSVVNLEGLSPLEEPAALDESGRLGSAPESDRRRALARRLARASLPPGAASASSRPSPLPQSTPSTAPPEAPPAPPPTANREALTQDLRRRHEQRIAETRLAKIREYQLAAEQAFAEKNYIAAANSLRIAASLAPEDADLANRLEEVRAHVNHELADSFLDQARYEEQHQHWAEAARSYERAALGKPSAAVHERVAYCLLESRGEARAASDHARRAVNLAPDVPGYRVTLARVYLAAGMRQSAVAELERAQSMAPNDDTIRTWLKRIRRNEV
jgi:curved DNA-binding protein CbpA